MKKNLSLGMSNSTFFLLSNAHVSPFSYSFKDFNKVFLAMEAKFDLLEALYIKYQLLKKIFSGDALFKSCFLIVPYKASLLTYLFPEEERKAKRFLFIPFFVGLNSPNPKASSSRSPIDCST